MDLTEQQKTFAEARAQGMTGEEAVNAAGYKSKGKAARVQCARLLANDSIVEYIKQLRGESKSKAVKSAQDVKEDLSAMMDTAREASDFTGYVSMATRLAKMDGHDEPERRKLEIEVNIGGNSED